MMAKEIGKKCCCPVLIFILLHHLHVWKATVQMNYKKIPSYHSFSLAVCCRSIGSTISELCEIVTYNSGTRNYETGKKD